MASFKGKPMDCACVFGIFFILIGVSIVTSVLFGISIPVGRIVFGCLFFYMGIQLITGYSKWSSWSCCAERYGSVKSCKTCCGKVHVQVHEHELNADSTPLEYSTVFGSARIDLTKLSLDVLKEKGLSTVVFVKTVFGKTELEIDKQVPVRIVGKGAFSKTSFPDKTMITFGTHTYVSHDAIVVPLLIIHTDTVFGALEIESK